MKWLLIKRNYLLKLENYRFFALGVLFMGLVFVGQEYYRPWVVENAANDFGLANYWPSLFGCFCAIFFAISFVKKQERVSSSFWTSVGCAVYEILQPMLGTGVFDWADLVAVCFAGTACTLGLLVKSWMSQSSNDRK